MDRLISEQAVLNILPKYRLEESTIAEEVKAIPSAEPKWIPVSEKLPEYDEEVLCFLESNEMAVLYRENEWGQDVWVDGSLGTGCYEVIAWMPLPTQYRERR